MSGSASPAQNSAELKSVADISGEQFIVPQYQRGYRWTPPQVDDLLNDLWHFHCTAPAGAFYCLQPIIVKPQDAQWELIDGQQRLTTIYILLRYLRNIIKPSDPRCFSLEFATRLNSRDFLQNINLEWKNKNIDYFHICGAQECIEAWFKNHPGQEVALQMHTTLVNHTKIIWYQLDDTPGAEHAVFMRINSGKIPLTNSELIKALFLKRSAEEEGLDQRLFARRQLEIATDWDRMEARLQDDPFWHFLNTKPKQTATRIDFVFNSLLPKEAPKYDEYDTFRYFSKKLSNSAPEAVLKRWQRVKERFQLLENWYTDRNLFHLVGFLITVEVPLSELIRSAKKQTKSAFKSYLKHRIAGLIEWERLEVMSYGPDSQQLQKVLLLFNVETMRKSKGSGNRFPYHEYKGAGVKAQTWSLEHIHAQKDQGLNSSDDFRLWLEEALPPLKEEALKSSVSIPKEEKGLTRAHPAELLARVNELLEKGKIDKADFEPLRHQLVSFFGKPDLHTIENLALLAADHNASLSNRAFPQKRARIIELEKDGEFIPIATRNVFLKYYTPQAQDLNYWMKKDRKNYLATIQEKLKRYANPNQAIA